MFYILLYIYIPIITLKHFTEILNWLKHFGLETKPKQGPKRNSQLWSAYVEIAFFLGTEVEEQRLVQKQFLSRFFVLL